MSGQTNDNGMAFLELVQLHERTWGTEQYTGRPSLAELIAGPIVVMWVEVTRPAAKPAPKRITSEDIAREGRFTLAVYQNAEELNEALLSIIFASHVSDRPCRKIAKIFANQKPTTVTGVKLLTDKSKE
jgi:hypothetical protein